MKKFKEYVEKTDEEERRAPTAPALFLHRVAVTVSDPDHVMVSKRKEKQQKFVRVWHHTNNKDEAIRRGKKHYEKKGFKVHDAEHVGIMEEKDEREYGYEGDMAISQLKTIVRHSEMLLSMLKPETDLPEWVQSKITLATDYIQTSHDYLMSEGINETVLNPKDPHGDYKEKNKTLNQLSMTKGGQFVDQKIVQQRKLDLDKEYGKYKK